MRIGIFGGSFNPVHEGHLVLARNAYDALNLERVIFVPSYQTPLKDPNVLSKPAERIQHLKKALTLYPYFSISLCEVERKGVSYTVDTLRYFKKKFGADAVLFFLTGADTLQSLRKWKSLGEIRKLCHFVVASRPGYPLKTPSWALALPMDAKDISSTRIRRKKSKTTKKSA